MTCDAWPIIGCDTNSADPDILAAATSAAQVFLNEITGGRLGVCQYRHRFQARQRSVICEPVTTAGLCCAISLPKTPVYEVLEVLIDEVAVPATGYWIVGGNRLARSGCWPTSTDCDPGRVTVTYRAGIPLLPAVYTEPTEEEPEVVLVTPASTYYGIAGAAMGEVVREYIEGMCGRACKLPSRFVSVARQGVSTVGLSPELFLRLGITGMPLTDNLVRTVNPTGLRRRPRVVSIDGPRRY